MKKLLIGLIILAIGVIAFGALSPRTRRIAARGGTDETQQYQYSRIVGDVTADATELAINTSDWNAIDSTFFPINPEWNVVELAFWGYGDGTGVGSPNNATFSFIVYLCRPYSNAKVAYSGTGRIGAMQMSVNPTTGISFRDGDEADPNNCWTDTIDPNGNGDTWISQVTLAEEGGNDSLATLSLDVQGYYGIWVLIKDMTAQSVTRIRCVATGY